MKKKYYLKVLTLVILSISTTVFSQTNKEIKEIQKSYNLEKLKNLAEYYRLESKQNKEKALKLAQQKGWPISYIDQDGSFNELVSVTADEKPIYNQTTNVNAARSTRANWLHNGGGLGLNVEGQGMTAHVWDAGLARSTHQEYDGAGGDNRYSSGDGSTSLNFHGAHVTGTIISSGFDSGAKGMAPQAKGIGYDWNSDLSEVIDAASTGMLLSNHSYVTSPDTVSDEDFGAYIGLSRSWDVAMYNAPYYLAVLASGNEGNSSTLNGDR